MASAAGSDKAASRRHGVKKPGTGGRKIIGRYLAAAQPVLKKTGGGGKLEVGRDGSDDDLVDIFGNETGIGDRLPGRFHGEIAGGLALGRLPTFDDAGPLTDPFVRSLHHSFEILVGDAGLRQIAAGSGNDHPV